MIILYIYIYIHNYTYCSWIFGFGIWAYFQKTTGSWFRNIHVITCLYLHIRCHIYIKATRVQLSKLWRSKIWLWRFVQSNGIKKPKLLTSKACCMKQWEEYSLKHNQKPMNWKWFWDFLNQFTIWFLDLLWRVYRLRLTEGLKQESHGPLRNHQHLFYKHMYNSHTCYIYIYYHY